MRLPITSLALVSIACASAIAEEKVYTLDASHTQATFSVERFGFTSVIGAFAHCGGTLWLDEEHPERSRVEAWADTDSVWTGDAERDGYLRGKLWLDAAANPRLTFKSTRALLTGPNTLEVTADVTLFGQTHPVKFQTRLNKVGIDVATKQRAAGFSLSGEISRKAFGSSTATALIGDAVKIHIEALGESPK